jgi:hypothetical protein
MLRINSSNPCCSAAVVSLQQSGKVEWQYFRYCLHSCMLHSSPQPSIFCCAAVVSLQESGQVEWQAFSYFLFLTSAVRGPFIPTYLQGTLHWADGLLQ